MKNVRGSVLANPAMVEVATSFPHLTLSAACLLGVMGGGLIDYLWTGVKATYIAIFATSFATVRSSSTQGCITSNIVSQPNRM